MAGTEGKLLYRVHPLAPGCDRALKPHPHVAPGEREYADHFARFAREVAAAARAMRLISRSMSCILARLRSSASISALQEFTRSFCILSSKGWRAKLAPQAQLGGFFVGSWLPA